MTITSKPSFAIGAKLADYISQIIPNLDKQIINWCHLPDIARGDQFRKDSKFCAIELSTGAIGISFASYIPPDATNAEAGQLHRIIGKSTSNFVPLLGKDNALPIERALAMAVINALSTKYIEEKKLTSKLLYEDGIVTLNIQPCDVIGMIGLFTPSIVPIAKQASFLHVVELNPDLVQSHEKWDVTMDHSILKKCNKIIVTGSVLLNGSLSSLLELITHAEHVALIGPTASFLPDPLFDLGFDIVGGTIVVDPIEFKKLFTNSRPWGNSAKKFVVQKKSWSEI